MARTLPIGIPDATALDHLETWAKRASDDDLIEAFLHPAYCNCASIIEEIKRRGLLAKARKLASARNSAPKPFSAVLGKRRGKSAVPALPAEKKPK